MKIVYLRKKIVMYTVDEIISKANEIHGYKYEYDKNSYTKVTEKMRIICPIHGEFFQSPHQHINKKQGCPHCGKQQSRSPFVKQNKLPKDVFLLRANERFAGKFQYDLSNYKNQATPIRIMCPAHGEFYQSPYVHLNSAHGCPKCAAEIVSKNLHSNTNEFINKAREIHGDKYDYSLVDYINCHHKVTIICPDHGEFQQAPYNHLSGNGCPLCGHEHVANLNTLTIDEFITKACKVHGSKYDYSHVIYKNYRTPISIVCPVHGLFTQTPDDHLQGKGCRKCANQLSNPENEIYELCCNFLGKDNVIQSAKGIIPPYELDIYIPSLKIAIEYNGLRWHSEEFGKDKNYHLNKLNMCKVKGIKLIHVFEDEFLTNKEIVLSKISHLIGCQSTLPHIMGRKCTIKEIGFKDAQVFLTANHIQGYTRSSVYLGAYFDNLLIGVMTFKEEYVGSKKWELNRFATSKDFICQGVGGKLFSFFIKNFYPLEIKSFTDRRWTISENNIYTKLGFVFDSYTSPEYRYFKSSDGIVRQHKFGFRKQILHKKYGLPLTMTETEMTEKLGYTKIWDCGLIKYVWKKEKGAR